MAGRYCLYTPDKDPLAPPLLLRALLALLTALPPLLLPALLTALLTLVAEVLRLLLAVCRAQLTLIKWRCAGNSKCMRPRPC